MVGVVLGLHRLFFYFAKVRIKRIYLFKKDILWYNKIKKVLLNGGIE
ncbi:hypothetical protein HMPREF3200_01239 [Anaerococcus tetradius]|uniref:Uncharacterized protein n=1 Tax=Anaerococcus tetradius TaxID=33036 RepID=A0A133KDF1_9FIRM|nr:hypothetical protein HMPREF3200_01239 [Anaerococcus tetradius]